MSLSFWLPRHLLLLLHAPALGLILLAPSYPLNTELSHDPLLGLFSPLPSSESLMYRLGTYFGINDTHTSNPSFDFLEISATRFLKCLQNSNFGMDKENAVQIQK